MEGVLFEVGFHAEYEKNHTYFIFPFYSYELISKLIIKSNLILLSLF